MPSKAKCASKGFYLVCIVNGLDIQDNWSTLVGNTDFAHFNNGSWNKRKYISMMLSPDVSFNVHEVMSRWSVKLTVLFLPCCHESS